MNVNTGKLFIIHGRFISLWQNLKCEIFQTRWCGLYVNKDLSRPYYWSFECAFFANGTVDKGWMTKCRESVVSLEPESISSHHKFLRTRTLFKFSKINAYALCHSEFMKSWIMIKLPRYTLVKRSLFYLIWDWFRKKWFSLLNLWFPVIDIFDLQTFIVPLSGFNKILSIWLRVVSIHVWLIWQYKAWTYPLQAH